jgi:putative membrane protein
MNLMWWFVWCVLFLWIFVLPFDIPGQRRRKDSALDILQKRFANSEISVDEYNEKRKIIENDLSGLS